MTPKETFPSAPDGASPAGVHVWLIVMKAYQALEKFALRSIESSGLCFSDFKALEILLHKGDMPINTLGDKLSLTSGALTALVDRLEKRGYVERRFDPTDRRVRQVALTPAGTAVIQPIFQQHRADMEVAMAALSSQEQAQLITLLKQVGRHTEALLSAPSHH